MKNLKSSLFLFILLSSTIIFIRCSKEENINSDLDKNAKVSSFLKSFYNDDDYRLGKSVESKLPKEANSLSRTIDFEEVSITEVFVGEETRARGYLITDKATNDFLYFVDVDRVDFKLTSVKIDANETKTFNEINELDKYLSTDELDYIKIVEDFNNDPSLERRRFWGSQPSNCVTEYVGGGCTQQFCDYDYYVFWISVEHLSHIPTGQMDCD